MAIPTILVQLAEKLEFSFIETWITEMNHSQPLDKNWLVPSKRFV